MLTLIALAYSDEVDIELSGDPRRSGTLVDVILHRGDEKITVTMHRSQFNKIARQWFRELEAADHEDEERERREHGRQMVNGARSHLATVLTHPTRRN